DGSEAVEFSGEFRRADEDGSEAHGADDGADVALEKVRAHAGDVAHVVAHVVCDGGGVERVVFGNAGLHLADEVRAYVRGFRVNAATDTGEERDGGGSEGKPGDDGHDLGDVPGGVSADGFRED